MSRDTCRPSRALYLLVLLLVACESPSGPPNDSLEPLCGSRPLPACESVWPIEKMDSTEVPRERPTP